MDEQELKEIEAKIETIDTMNKDFNYRPHQILSAMALEYRKIPALIKAIGDRDEEIKALKAVIAKENRRLMLER